MALRNAETTPHGTKVAPCPDESTLESRLPIQTSEGAQIIAENPLITKASGLYGAVLRLFVCRHVYPIGGIAAVGFKESVPVSNPTVADRLAALLCLVVPALFVLLCAYLPTKFEENDLDFGYVATFGLFGAIVGVYSVPTYLGILEVLLGDIHAQLFSRIGPAKYYAATFLFSWLALVVPVLIVGSYFPLIFLLWMIEWQLWSFLPLFPVEKAQWPVVKALMLSYLKTSQFPFAATLAYLYAYPLVESAVGQVLLGFGYELAIFGLKAVVRGSNSFNRLGLVMSELWTETLSLVAWFLSFSQLESAGVFATLVVGHGGGLAITYLQHNRLFRPHFVRFYRACGVPISDITEEQRLERVALRFAFTCVCQALVALYTMLFVVCSRDGPAALDYTTGRWSSTAASQCIVYSAVWTGLHILVFFVGSHFIKQHWSQDPLALLHETLMMHPAISGECLAAALILCIAVQHDCAQVVSFFDSA